MKNTKFVGILLLCALTFLAAYVGSIASIRASDFYSELERPSWAPPGWIFGPVWTTLYCLMAISASLVWATDSKDKYPKDKYLGTGIYAAQLLLNSLWSWLFFAWKNGAFAFGEVILLAGMVLANVIVFWRVHRVAAVLLIPYLLCVMFASCLTYKVWQLNPTLL